MAWRSLPVENENNRILSPQLAYVELPPEEPKANVPKISIRTKKATIEISGVSDELAVKLVKAAYKNKITWSCDYSATGLWR